VNDADVERAMSAWSRTVFGAPRRMAPLVQRIDVRDEIIERVFTRVARRTLTESRAPSFERHLTLPAANATTLDPFAYTSDSLRAATQHVVTCAGCGGAAVQPCGQCSGSGHARCAHCHGSGTQASEKTGRQIKCKTCKGSGRVTCGVCTGGGSVPCRACTGSGHQLSWSILVEEETTSVKVEPPSPTVTAHPALVQARPLADADVAAFATLAESSAVGAVDPARVNSAQLVVAAQREVNARSERIIGQQYLKLGVVRRDVTYEMCGTTGTVSFSGRPLVGATTPDAVRPIRRRSRVWAVTTVLAIAALVALRAGLVGRAAYFATAQSATTALAVLGSLGAIIALGGVWRSWRGGLRFRGVGTLAIATGVIAVASAVAIAGIGLLVRPTPAEAEAALAAGRPAEARAVIDALREQSGSSPAVADLDDRVVLASLGAGGGESDLAVLDGVATHGGRSATDAKAKARAIRRRVVDERLAAHDPATALKDLDAWFPESQRDPDAAAARARAHDVAAEACRDPACRYTESSRAAAAATSPQRDAAKAASRTALLAALAPGAVPTTSPLAHASGARALRALAEQSTGTGDPDIGRAAAAANTWADDERAKTALLGSTADVAAELLGAPLAAPRPQLASVALDGGTVYFSLDAKGTIRGVYLVGADADRHEYRSTSWPPDQLLAQAVGHPLRHPWPAPSKTDARWYEGAVPVIARWRGSSLVELRVGDATP
jgi:hypothetical protein